MKLTDGKKTIDIRMMAWDSINNSGFSPDWSNDFFEAGSLDCPYNEVTDTYIVHDVDNCIEQAMDWKYSRGDFSSDEFNPNNTVFIKEI